MEIFDIFSSYCLDDNYKKAYHFEGINYCSNQAITHKKLRCLPVIIENTFNISTVLPTAGRAIQWAKELFFCDKTSYESILDRASKIQSGASYIFFIDIPQKTYSQEQIKDWFINVASLDKPYFLIQALIIALVHNIQQIITDIKKQGFTPKELIVSGGIAKSSYINQLKADILELPVHVPHIVDAELTGDACLGFNYLGEYSSLSQAADSMAKIVKVMQSQP